MGTITDFQCAKFRQKLHDESFDLLQAESPALTKAEIKTAFQMIEDFWENNRTTLKTNIETVLGKSISNNLAKKIGKWWLEYKWRGE